MLRRFREYLRREEELKAKAKDEVYKEVAEWDRRRKNAEAQDMEFTEPPPTQPEENHEKIQKNKVLQNNTCANYPGFSSGSA